MRGRKPSYKAKVASGVQVVERWILADRRAPDLPRYTCALLHTRLLELISKTALATLAELLLLAPLAKIYLAISGLVLALRVESIT